MITKTQKTEIRNYLIVKNLPIDVILEVKDHFETQIENLQFSKNFSFEEAFYHTKLLWSQDFALVRKSLLSFSKVPRIVRNIHREAVLNFIKQAILFGFVITFLKFVLGSLLSKDNFWIFQIGTNSIVTLSTFGLLLYYMFSKIQRPLVRAEIYYFNQLRNIFLYYICTAFIFSYLKVPDENLYSVIISLKNGHTSMSYFSYVILFISQMSSVTASIYFLLLLIDRKKSMAKANKYNLI